MKPAKPRHPRPSIDEFSITSGFIDAAENWRPTPPETHRLLRAAMGGQPPASDSPGPLIVRPGDRLQLPRGAVLHLEDGATLRAIDQLPADVPFGYHTLEDPDNRTSRQLIITPGECYLPDNFSVWGWSAQLYAVRSAQSWGIGDLADLRRLAKWAADQGAKMLLLNPLAADTPVAPLQPSPYSPTSRCLKNLLYLNVEEIPGASSAGPVIEAANAGRALNNADRINRDEVFQLKIAALRHLWDKFTGDPAFDRFREEQGELLTNFARFCALAEIHGRDWRTWPAQFQHPNSPAVAASAEANAKAVAFHAWVQWLIDQQLHSAAKHISFMQDLPIGVDPAGADAWIWQDLLARDVAVGVPPDLFNVAGQNWYLPPFIPFRLRAANYQPFIQTIRANLRHAGGLRIDHVMGLFRLYWIPTGHDAAAGAFVLYPADDLLAILALESHRAQALIVGEDLGTTDKQALRVLADHRVLSYRLVWFEADPPAKFPRHALAAVSTHDLPTIAGLWTGQDERDEQTAGLKSNSAGWQLVRDRLKRIAHIDPADHLEAAILKTHRSLAEAPSVIVTAALEDALAIQHRQNMPGTLDTWPNWSQPLPGGLEALERSKLAAQIAAELNARRSSQPRSHSRAGSSRKASRQKDASD
jgi:4-alpha-glucanotransferase